jgi:phage baseplate assembly protein gpV
MKRGMLLSWVAAVIAAVVTGGCGSESPTAPSAGGVVVQGVVLGDGASVTAAADTQPASSRAKKVTVRVDGTTLSVDVSANGTFEFKGIPSGTFTLVFLADGVEIGRVEVTAEDGFEVKIVVQVTDSTLVLVEIKVENPDEPEDDDDTASSSCAVNGGKTGAGIELEGRVASGSSASFNLTATGRSSVPVVVDGSHATFRCNGSPKTTSDAACKASVKTGARVHVRGTLMSCTEAKVTAIEVKVQKSDDSDDDDDD